ncbi:PilZ domain-containing protein [Paenibacillus thermotolerans]|uniref:PilZ domain-containing protein n=1 Tax=Paenibacillus thermotolerans TaxID=3027807 RepID=UPI002368221B|nr:MULTISPECIES: PilZ domain-containing protein [unclassified Paenibacillus]
MPFLRVDELNHHSKNSVAIGNKVSVEKKDFVSVGMVTFIEGDIIEVELPQAKYYAPGDPIKVTVYSNNGFLILPSSVIAKDNEVIMILNPPENQRLTQRRQHPRIDIQSEGFIRAIIGTNQSVQPLEEPFPFHISNISLGGVGLIASESVPLRTMTVAETEFNILGGVQCRVEVSRRQTSERGVYIGAKFLDFPQEQLNSLRGFILRTQIDARVKQRREEAAM